MHYPNDPDPDNPGMTYLQACEAWGFVSQYSDCIDYVPVYYCQWETGCYKIDNPHAPNPYNPGMTDIEVCANDGFVSQYSDCSDYPSVSTFKDSRDGKTYKYVEIGTQRWMAENLNFNASGSKCYGESGGDDWIEIITSGQEQTYCDKYGRLYDWSTAMNGSSSSSANPSGVQGVCPDGWHLPSDVEWTELENSVGGSSIAGRKLKSQSGWNGCGPVGSHNLYRCEDAYGWSALPGGYGDSDGNFRGTGGYGDGFGFWWSATEKNDDANTAWRRDVGRSEYVLRGFYDKTLLHSVRCVQN